MRLLPRKEPIIAQVEQEDDNVDQTDSDCSKQKGSSKKKMKTFKKLICCLAIRKIRHQEPNNPPNSIQAVRDARAALRGGPTTRVLLPEPTVADAHLKCLVIDLDETLVHSSFKPVDNPDYVLSIDIDGTMNDVYVLKRPFCDEFLQRAGQLFECVLFTASLAKYAEPVSNFIDRWGVFRHRLFRDACMFISGSYVKDLDQIGRNVDNIIIVDNSPASYAFHPDNAIGVNSWFGDPDDRELLDLIPVLDDLYQCTNIRTVLSGGVTIEDSVIQQNQNGSNSSDSPLSR